MLELSLGTPVPETWHSLVRELSGKYNPVGLFCPHRECRKLCGELVGNLVVEEGVLLKKRDSLEG